MITRSFTYLTNNIILYSPYVDRLLTIEAKVNEETEHTKMHQSLNYEYSVPESVDIEALESLFTTDGVLTIEAPKTPEEAPRTINIKRE